MSDDAPDAEAGLDWPRLAAAVRARRKAMQHMTVREAALRAEVSDTTWNKLEAGHPVSERTLDRVASALRWTAESPFRVLWGGDPELSLNQRLARRSATLDYEESLPSPADAEPAEMPAGFRRKYSDATPEERAKLEAYLDGLLANRDE